MTTEGGGAIAFPVMTIALNIDPIVARDFSLMIQSCGLTAAAFTIFFMSITIEWHSLVFSTIGAIFGIVFGLEVVDSLLSPAEKKMAFVSIFFSFALALYLLNSEKKRVTFDSIQNFTVIKAITLMVNGFIGGIFTGVAGSGIDVYSFSILTLLFRISEKVATPTSVVLMSANSMAGFFWRRFMDDAISQDAWEYLAVCLPVVVFFAPLGSFIASYFHRLTLAVLIYILETVALVGAIIVIRPALPLLCVSAALITLSFAFYYSIGRYGKLMANRHLKLQQKAVSVACIS
uniref:Membrane transporter protein n=1 Tax=Parascaris univalens TaxID=6257 RepID=A0A915BQS8_PARUN